MLLIIPVRAVNPDTLTPGVDMSGHDLVREALLEIGVLNPTQDLGAEEGEYGLSKLNRMFDRWNADRRCAFATAFTPYTLTGGLSPHTIGPTGTFVVAQRPVTIDGANHVSAGTRTPITVRDRDWYMGLSTPAQTGSIPTDCYYEPAMPNGQLYFYPVPSGAVSVELWTRGILGRMALTDQLVAPAGYRDAIVRTLAEELVAPFQVQMPQDLPQSARAARALIFANNVSIPRLHTRDAGMPGGRGSSWNYVTGDCE